MEVCASVVPVRRDQGVRAHKVCATDTPVATGGSDEVYDTGIEGESKRESERERENTLRYDTGAWQQSP